MPARTDQIVGEVDATISQFAGERDNLILILHEIQNAHGYVPRESALLLSEKLKIPLARIYEVLTFYHYFRTEPPDQHKVVVCNGTSCWLAGSEQVLDQVRSYAANHTEIRVEQVRCVGCCALAPLAFADRQICTHLSREKVSVMLAALEAPEAEL